MAPAFMRPFFRPQVATLGLGLGLSLAGYHTVTHRRPILLDGPLLSNDSYRRNTQTPALRRGQLNPAAVRQMSSGSILGLCGGFLVSTFSRSLALLIGLLIVGVQWASSYGIKVIPYEKLQRHVTSVDLRSAVQDNIAFKLSFGTTFALAAFMQF